MLEAEKIYTPPKNHADIQDIYWIKGTSGRAGMATMAATLIDPKFKEMKKEFRDDEVHRVGHKYWECKPLSKINIEYAAIDGYIAYELYNILTAE